MLSAGWYLKNKHLDGYSEGFEDHSQSTPPDTPGAGFSVYSRGNPWGSVGNTPRVYQTTGPRCSRNSKFNLSSVPKLKITFK